MFKKIEHILKLIIKELDKVYYNFKDEWKEEIYVRKENKK